MEHIKKSNIESNLSNNQKPADVCSDNTPSPKGSSKPGQRKIKKLKMEKTAENMGDGRYIVYYKFGD